jgi:hypothetical protein
MLGIDGPEQRSGGGELVDGGAVVRGEVDIAGRVDDRLRNLVSAAEVGRQREAANWLPVLT